MILLTRCVPRLPTQRTWRGPVAAAACLLLTACASPVLRDAEQLSLTGQHEEALKLLDEARVQDPRDHAVQAAQQRERELTVAVLANQAEDALAKGRLEAAQTLLTRLEKVDANNPRAQTLKLELERSIRQQKSLTAASQDIDAGRLDEAEAKVRQVMVESPGLPAARALQRRLTERTVEPELPPTIAVAMKKRITLEFRDAPVRTVFESIGRTLGVNFVFDRDVRPDAKVSILLRDVTLDEAMRVIMASQQLDRKLLNETSMFIYPNTPAKQQEHQELVTRAFYLSNADAKQAQALVRTMAKTRDIYVDDRLNLMIVRDTPDVVRLIERLVASIDMPEPEVMLEVTVMEIGTNELDQLGIQWPSTIDYGLTGVTGSVNLSQFGQFRSSVLNPALTATINATSGSTNLIANPKLRARNHEKARVQIGEKLPIFTTTAVVNAGTGTSVNYLDTGLKLEVEPSVQLDNDVIMKVNLEVTNLIGQVTGPGGSIAYRVGTRNASTSLRLRDGETQILAGLINDEDSKSIQGIPGASRLPVVGRLFGVHNDTLNKSEIVLLITPRVVRNLGLPDAATLSGPAGNFANPGALSTRIHSGGAIAMPMANGRPAAAAVERGVRRPAPEADTAPSATQAPASEPPVLQVSTSGQAVVGETVSVTLQNNSDAAIRGQFSFDDALLQSAGVLQGNRADFDIVPRGQKVFVLRALPAAAGKSTQVQVDVLNATMTSGETVPIELRGDTTVTIGLAPKTSP